MVGITFSKGNKNKKKKRTAKETGRKKKLTCIIAHIIIYIEIANVKAFQHVRIPFFAIIGIEQHVEHTLRIDILETWVYFNHLEIATGHRTCPNKGICFAHFQRPTVVIVHQPFQRCEIVIVRNACQLFHFNELSADRGKILKRKRFCFVMFLLPMAHNTCVLFRYAPFVPGRIQFTLNSSCLFCSFLVSFSL